MPWHLSAFGESVDQTLDNIVALTDGVLHTSGDDLFVADGYNHLLGAWAGSATMERARLVANSLTRSKVDPDVRPVDGVEPSATPLYYWHDYRQTPIVLVPGTPGSAGDRLNAQIENDGVGAAEDARVLVWLGNGPVQPLPGPWYPVRFVISAAALSPDVWNAERTITLSQRLDPGIYAVGGARLQSASLIGYRFVFKGQTHRPGGLGCDDDNDGDVPAFRRGGMGEWGRFAYDQPPTVQLLADAADNEAQEGILDVRKVA